MALLERERVRRFLLGSLLSLATFLLLGVLLELGFRTYRLLRYDDEFFARLDYRIQDPLLGWSGSQLFGDPDSERLKILFVGDSFTFCGTQPQGLWRRASHKYYGIVRQNLDFELFVYGGAGYGTFQEYLVIDRLMDEIEPDLVILQTTSNDFVNNYWLLEKESWVHNNYLIRPYLEGERTVYRYPRGPAFIREVLLPYSHLVYHLVLRWDQLMAERASQGDLPTVEEEILRSGLEDERFAAAVEVTDRLVGMIKERCGETPLVAFPVLSDEPYIGQFRQIFERHEIPFLEEIPELAWAAEEAAAHTAPRGLHGSGHWGQAGHAACGQYLTDYLKERFGLPELGTGSEQVPARSGVN